MSLPKLFLEVIGVSGSANAMLRGLGRDVSVATQSVGTDSKKLLTATNAIYAGIAGAAAYVGDKTVKMAADFQTGITRIKTDGGELQQNLAMVSKGILDMAGQVGMSTKQLTDGMMTVEASGQHGADALLVLKAAAEGAKVGAADLGTTANALTSLINAYGMKASDANGAMSQLVATVAAGKMHMEDLASSLSTVLPVAASAHISFDQVGGAIATMTAQGVSAQQATQNLAGLIRALQAPSDVASKEMAQLGLSSTDLAQHLGERGLVGTLTILTEKIASQMGPSGLIVSNALNQSKAAAADAQTMLKQLPPTLQDLAHRFLDNQITAKQWTAALKGQPVMVANLGKQFATTAKHANGFNDLLRSGSPAAQTYAQALEKATGGSMGLNTALLLSGDHMDTFDGNAASVADAAKHAGAHVKDWGDVQKTFNQRLSEAKGHAEALGIRIGSALLPAVQGALSVTMSMVDWLGKHKTTAQALIGTVGSLVGVFMAYKTVTLGIAAAKKAAAIAEDLWTVATKAASAATKLWTAAQWLLDAAMDANPIGLIIIAVAALAAGIYLLWTHSAGFRKFFIGLWSDIWGFLKGVGHWFANDFAGFFVHAWDSVVGGVKKAGSAIHHAWSATINFFTSLPGKIGRALEALPGELGRAIQRGLDALFYWMGYGIGWVIKQWLEMPGRIWRIITDLWRTANDLVSRGISAMVDFFVKLPGRVESEAKRLWSMITKAWADGVNWVTTTVSKWWDDTTKAISHGIDVAIDWVSKLPGRIEHWFTDMYDRATKWASKTIDDVVTWIRGLPGRAYDEASKLPGKIMDAVKDAGTWLYNTGKDIITGLINGIKGAWKWAVDEVKRFMGDLLGGAKDAIKSKSPSRKFADEVGRWIPHGIAAGIKEHAGVAADAMRGLMDNLVATPTPELAGPTFGPGALSPMPGGLPSFGAGLGPLGTQSPIVVQSDVHVYLDSDELRNATVMQAQRNKLRNGRSLMT